MNRRDFLKVGTVLLAAFLVPLHATSSRASPPLEARSGDKLYRGTSDGKIYVSANQGKHWQLHTNFGSAFSIFDLAADYKEQVHAQLGFAGYSFELALAQEGNIWRTV